MAVEEIAISKLVNGGQGLGTLNDGRKVFVWNALPGEIVQARIIKSKKNYAEAITDSIVLASSQRIQPLEPNYLSTSPWQIMSFQSENTYKKEITNDLFRQAHITLPTFQVTCDERVWNYRNKMEYSFWGDEDGLHLALHERGSHRKEIVKGSVLAMESIDVAARSILNRLPINTRAGDLKTVIIRSDQIGNVVAALFVKNIHFPDMKLPASLKGLRIYYSDPKSPASVPTKLLYERGSVQLVDVVRGVKLRYDVDSFFQVNVPVFEKTLNSMASYVDENVTDMYAGVGSIGLCLAKKSVQLVEHDENSYHMAVLNAQNSSINSSVIHAASEAALDSIISDNTIIFDPPRAGLHQNIIHKLLETLPMKIVYLSCNPATQVRDITLLQKNYNITHFEMFNYFPRTPHIETLAVMIKK